MRKSNFVKSIVLIVLICVTLCLITACSESSEEKGQQIYEVYTSYVVYAQNNNETPLSYEEWLKRIKGESGVTPEFRIDSLTGMWEVSYDDGGTWKSLNYKACGKDGIDGKNGSSVTVASVEKVKTENNVDTYQIVFSDGVKTTFTVSNGVGVTVQNVVCKSSVDGIDVYEIEFSDGYTTTFTVTNGKDGKDISIVKIEKVASEGLYDTYRISYSNNTTWDFVVSNGVVPYIGTNGHWWINDTDTNIVAGYPDDDMRKHTTESMIATAGLIYSTMTIDGITGYVVESYSYSQAEEIAANYYNQYKDTMTSSEYTTYIQSITRGKADIIIPNYVGSVPVIGIKAKAFSNDDVCSVSLSKNTIYMGKNAFEDATNLKSVDFNNCSITYIPEGCFYDSGLTEVALPETVVELHNNAFRNCKLIKFDYSDITYFGDYSLYGNLLDYIYLSNDVEYVGNSAFSNGLYDNFVYVEKDANTDDWYELNKINADPAEVFTDCLRNDDLIYKINSDDTITAYKYFKEEKIVSVPSSVDGKTITILGGGFLNQENRMYYYREVASEQKSDYFSKISTIKQVIIPNTIKTIESGAIDLIDAFVYIPSSVEKFDSKICTMGADFYDEYGKLASFLAFESESLPKIYNGGTEVETTDYENSITKCNRYNTGITLSKVQYNESDETFYYVDIQEASVLACMSSNENTITMLDAVGLIPVKTIMSQAYRTNARTVIIGSNISKIHKEGLTLTNASYLYIPSNVKVINKYGVKVNCPTIYIAVDSIPDDWDTKWQGSSGATIKYGVNLTSNDKFTYFICDNEITLVSHKITSDTIVLPSSIDGYTVTSIAAGFDVQTGGKKIYIPASIVNCERYGFASNKGSGYAYFYFEASSVPSGFVNYWYGSPSSYGYQYTNQTMPDSTSE